MSGTISGVEFTHLGDHVNMHIFRGKTLSFDIIWGGATPIDITGYQATLQARNLEGETMLDLSTQNGGIIIDGSNGTLQFKASPTLTRQVRKIGHYELEMTTTEGDVYRVISGTMSPIEEVVI